jgi:hypothetical protein
MVAAEDMLFHTLYIGSAGAGKTNALLYWLPLDRACR